MGKIDCRAVGGGIWFGNWYTGNKHMGTYCGDGHILYLSNGDNYMDVHTQVFVKTHQNVHIKWMHFIVCKLYFKNLWKNKVYKK